MSKVTPEIIILLRTLPQFQGGLVGPMKRSALRPF